MHASFIQFSILENRKSRTKEVILETERSRYLQIWNVLEIEEINGNINVTFEPKTGINQETLTSCIYSIFKGYTNLKYFLFKEFELSPIDKNEVKSIRLKVGSKFEEFSKNDKVMLIYLKVKRLLKRKYRTRNHNN